MPLSPTECPRSAHGVPLSALGVPTTRHPRIPHACSPRFVQLTFRAACDLPAGTECFIAYVATEEPTYVLARWRFDGVWIAPGARLERVWLDCVWSAS